MSEVLDIWLDLLGNVSFLDNKTVSNNDKRFPRVCENISVIDTCDNTSFKYDPKFSISFLVVISAILIFGVIANAGVITSISRKRHLRSSPTFIVLFSMAVSDLIRLSLIGLHMNLQLIFSSWIAGGVWCQIFLFVLFSMAQVGNSHIALIAVFRYIILVHPFFARRLLTKNKTAQVCITVWFVVTVLNIPMALSAGIVTTPVSGRNHATCQPTSRAVYLVRCIMCYLIPLAVIAGFHAAKVRILSHNQDIPCTAPTGKKNISHCCVVLIILTFVICWMPKAIIWFQVGALGLNINAGVALTMSSVMSCANSVFNPVIYFFSFRNFRNKTCFQRETRSDYNLHNRKYMFLCALSPARQDTGTSV